jgi:hypothetical protein
MVRIKLNVVNADGSPGDYYEGRSHTWVRNGYNTFIALFSNFTSTGTSYGAGYLSLKDVGGTVRNPTWGTSGTDIPLSVGVINNSLYGIVVGTGTTAESFEHNAMATIVANGSGGGQMAYAAQSATTSAYTAGTKTWDMTMARVMNNNSGGNIVVAETGIQANASALYFLLNRDLLGATVTVNNGAQLTVTYTMSLILPA